MEAIVLAGGFGTRMRPLTYTRPKPLLPLLNRPLLRWILDRMPQSIDTILLPVNYLQEQVHAYFEEHPDPRVVLVEELNPLGTGGAIKNCEDHLTGAFLVVNGDIVSSVDLTQFFEAHRKSGRRATISLWPVPDPSQFGVVELRPDGDIARFVEKPKPGTAPSNLINAGHYALNLDVLDAIPPRKFVSLEREVFERWAPRDGALHGFRLAGYWIDCGRPESLLEAHAILLQQEGQSLIQDGSARVAASAQVQGYALAERVEVGPHARIERSILLPGVRVAKNAVVRDCILGEGVDVEDGATLEGTVVGDFAVIQAGSQIRGQRIGMRLEDVETP